ncbi:MAG: SRPBCC domain-containing protein [Dongiaceae bacterium]
MPAKAAAPVKPSLTLKRRFAASPERLYAAWTEPEKMMRWWGPAGAVTLHAEADPRVGGRYRAIFRTPDGEEHDVSGVYREVERPRKLVFSWAWRSTPERESLVTVTFAPEGEGTLLTLLQEQFFDEKARDDHREGWGEGLDNLEAYIAASR